MPADPIFELGDLRFTWNAAKSRRNVVEHGITFEEAATTWLDPGGVEAYDAAHSVDEDRWLRIGRSPRGLVIVTWWTVRPAGPAEAIRLIGARRANARESRLHEEHRT